MYLDNKLLGLTNSVVFSALFSKPKYTANFLNSTSYFNVEENDLRIEKKEFYENVNCKISNMDVVLRIEKSKELINLEFQNRETKYDMMGRLMIYLSRLISTNEPKGKGYVLNKSTVLAILNFTYFKDSECIRTFKMSDEYGHSLEGYTIIVIELTKKDFCNNIYLKKWLDLFLEENLETYESEDEFMKEVVEEIKRLNADEQMRINMIREEIYEKDRLSELEISKKEGLEEGIQLGLQQGVQQGSINVAKNMKNKGLDVSLIVEMTGLDEETIKKI